MQGTPRKRFPSGSGGGSGGSGDGSLTPRTPSATHPHDAAAAPCAGPGPAKDPASAPAGPARRSSCAGAADEAAPAPAAPPLVERSIYEVWTERKRYMLLCLMSFATFLVPFSDTVYLPALSVIQRELGTTQTLMAATIAVYMFVVGVTALFWGPFCDRWGRRNTLLISCSAFTLFSIGCVFSWRIDMLIAFRALQGAAVSAMMVAANAVLADSWEPAQRGKAMGVFAIPTLVGPIVGPLLGGGLSQMLGWRATFASMGVCGAIILVALLIFMEETQHHHVLKRLRNAEGDSAVMAIREHRDIQKPRFRAPWRPLKYLLEPSLCIHTLLTFLIYSTMMSALIILPSTLAHDPYSMSEALIGVSNLSLGLGCLFVGPLAGGWADAAARRWPASHSSRLFPGLAACLLVYPLSTLAYAWCFQMKTHVAGPLVASFFMGGAICAFFPGLMSYVSIIKQQTAAVAGAAVQAVLFISGGVFIQVTPPAVAAIGLGWWITILVGVCLLATVGSTCAAVGALRAGEREQLPLSAGAAEPAVSAVVVPVVRGAIKGAKADAGAPGGGP
ncbi:hypothetical protein Rsub_10719 [Raphidocelis subcapitata]|uniref:Major facilitator superfamily (MFS) profile domain-containing protein n=1 Tax=Raphidocelis subcapitata TaxID=307507 RepID=A0A2V0PI21_9CHLO|nr:hypothetical protein Rsub_10719 [Raphidocelis subcapitata]|eukprot:GBF97583.1 hypothetical protein Rsub_10719 [Raphidocelis subcapitata]